MWRKGNIPIVGSHVNWCSLYEEQYASSTKKYRVNMWSSKPTPRDISRQMYASERYRHPHVHRSTIQFMGALYNSWEHYTIAKTGKPPRCPSTGEWIKKMRYIYTTEYYSAKTSNETMLWKDLEFTKISEGSQKARNTIWYLLHLNMTQVNLSTQHE